MIKYTLNCKNGHQFDSWFSDSESFEKLRKKGHLECAICSSKEVDDTAKFLKLIVIRKKIIKILVIDNFFNFINILFIKRPDIFPQNFLFIIY